MERRLDQHPMNTPTHSDVLVPIRPTPSHDVESVVENQVTTERTVRYHAGTTQADRALERLSPQRIEELRMRLETGAYNSPEVMTELAMRLLESGDLG